MLRLDRGVYKSGLFQIREPEIDDVSNTQNDLASSELETSFNDVLKQSQYLERGKVMQHMDGS
jgi:hypothetical protein